MVKFLDNWPLPAIGVGYLVMIGMCYYGFIANPDVAVSTYEYWSGVFERLSEGLSEIQEGLRMFFLTLGVGL